MRYNYDPVEFLDGVVVLKDVGNHKAGVYRAGECGAEPDKNNVWSIDHEMIEGAELYRDTINEIITPHCTVMYETRLDIRAVHPDLWGTGDCVIYCPVRRKLFVIDYKYGSGIAVDAFQNEQGMTYAVGAAHLFDYQIDEIEIVIVQPRAFHLDGPVRTYVIDTLTLIEFEETLARYAALTDGADGDGVAGMHCRFCPVAGACPDLRDAVFKILHARIFKGKWKLPMLKSMTPKQLAETFENAQLVEIWVRRFYEHINDQMLSGKKVPGLKVVEGRAYRKWTDEVAVQFELEEAGYSTEDFMYPEKIKYPGTVEKLLGKKKFNELLGPLTKKPVGSPVVALESDKRPAINTNKGAAFGAVDD